MNEKLKLNYYDWPDDQEKHNKVITLLKEIGTEQMLSALVNNFYEVYGKSRKPEEGYTLLLAKDLERTLDNYRLRYEYFPEEDS
jgi:hypothetical protein